MQTVSSLQYQDPTMSIQHVQSVKIIAPTELTLFFCCKKQQQQVSVAVCQRKLTLSCVKLSSRESSTLQMQCCTRCAPEQVYYYSHIECREKTFAPFLIFCIVCIFVTLKRFRSSNKFSHYTKIMQVHTKCSF